jgi:hypothetical protein
MLALWITLARSLEASDLCMWPNSRSYSNNGHAGVLTVFNKHYTSKTLHSSDFEL